MQPKTEKVQNKDIIPTWWALDFPYLRRLFSAFHHEFSEKVRHLESPQPFFTYREPLLPECIPRET